MIIAIGSDHRGLYLKGILSDFLKRKKHEVCDVGTFSSDSCDYPVYCSRVAHKVRKHEADFGVLICKTGVGSAIAANKVRGIRAALVHTIAGAKLARQHNNANVLVLGDDFVNEQSAKKIISAWSKAVFEGGRHARRLNQIKKIEEHHEL